MSSLLEECIEALGREAVVLENDVGNEIFNDFERLLKFSINQIDWESYKDYLEIDTPQEILTTSISDQCYIMWDQQGIPVIKTNLKAIVENIDDVTAVSFDTYLFGVNYDWIIEFYHEGGRIRLAYL